LTIKNGFKICADPEMDWVKQIIEIKSKPGVGLCCFEFHKRPVPAASIVSVEQTRFDCTFPGVIFTTKKGYKICADPEMDWVKEIIKSK
ncbi:C-C motif chemokine 3-like, partial [Silurus asotus]